jgi:hypothetical protein
MKKNDENSEDNAKLKNMNNWGISKIEEKLKLKIFNFCGGVTHRIRMMISDTVYNCRRAMRIKFFINFFTLRELFFIDWRKTFIHVLHI